MKEMNLGRLINLANMASTISSIDTGEARKVAGQLLEIIAVESKQGFNGESDGVDTACAGLLVESTSGDVLIAKTRIDYLERVESDISRLVALIGLHDGSVAINAQAATSALTAEIGELIAKYKA